MKSATPNLKPIRELRLLTQAMLAGRAGVQTMTISRLERGGQAYPSTVRKLAAALDIEPNVLVGETEQGK